MRVAENVVEIIVMVAVPATNTPVAVAPTIRTVAVPPMAMLDDVTSVLPIEIEQLAESRDADKEMSVMFVTVFTEDTSVPVDIDVISVPVAVAETLIPVIVEPTNTAVAVENGTLIRNHAVPSLAIAQSLVAVAVEVTGKNRLETLTVFGVVV
jgi:hypothetical protein